ncbi:MAG: MOSC domain-containing protein [Cyanobacteriota bacterium]|nr:MOSC domain-containing protein [Cyanobacteriota bacterium]
MAHLKVGTVHSLWRYPVKSMLGEAIPVSAITAQGVWGDRLYALWDPERQRVASAKNPKKWAKLLNFQAKFSETVTPPNPATTVTITLPDGQMVNTDSPEIHTRLSQALGCSVELLSSVPKGASLDQYWPDVEGTAHQETITQLYMPPQTFFDSCSIHLITTATLARLQTLYPEGQFHVSRFRPNILIEPLFPTADFLENDWVGGILSIGESVKLSIDTACPRCVVTTLAQSDLPQDINILKTTARYNQVIAGIRTSVLEAGTIQQGDPIWLEKSV